MVRGYVRGLSNHYAADGLERMEIWVTKNKASSLPYIENMRVPIQLIIGSRSYNGGLRSTPDCEYVWICPDLIDSKNKKTRLAQALIESGFKKNERVLLSVEGDIINVAHTL